MDDINQNITFFFEDTDIDDLEDNELELEHMLQDFDVEYDVKYPNNIGGKRRKTARKGTKRKVRKNRKMTRRRK